MEMSEMKMRDYFFNGGIDSDDEGCLIENGFKIARGMCKYKASAISHAVSNHDSLAEEVERLRGERDDLTSVLRHAINGWDCEEVTHHCGVGSNTAARVIAMIEGEDNE